MHGEDIDSFCYSWKYVLHRGAYVVNIVPLIMYEKWFQSFNNCGFELMKHKYLIMYDCGQVKKRSAPKFPQQITEFAHIGKKHSTAHAILKRSFEED